MENALAPTPLRVFQESLVAWLLSLADCHQSRVGRSSDFRARTARPSRRVCLTLLRQWPKRLGCSLLLGYSGGAVPDSHRIPCLSALQMKRPTTNARSNGINLPRPQSVVKGAPCILGVSSWTPARRACHEWRPPRNLLSANRLRSAFVRTAAGFYSLLGAARESGAVPGLSKSPSFSVSQRPRTAFAPPGIT
jgi:hypothetical protein